METNLSAESSQETLRNLEKEDIIKSIRSNSVIIPYLRSSLQECKVELNLAKLEGLQKFYKTTEIKVKVTEGLHFISLTYYLCNSKPPQMEVTGTERPKPDKDQT